MLDIDVADSSFTIKNKEKNCVEANGFCLTNFLDAYVFFIGGIEVGRPRINNYLFKRVSRYDIVKNRWEEMPELNKARFRASACSLGDNIYVVGGQNSWDGVLNSLEKLKNPGLT